VDQQLESQNLDSKQMNFEDSERLLKKEDSDSDEMCFEKLLEKSQQRNAAVKVEQKVAEPVRSLEQNQIYPTLYYKCTQLYPPNKEYNKMKLFIDFTRLLTKLDINDNVWYYEDP